MWMERPWVIHLAWKYSLLVLSFNMQSQKNHPIPLQTFLYLRLCGYQPSSIMFLVRTEPQNRTNPSCGGMSLHNSTQSDIYICLWMILSLLDKVVFIGATSKINVKILWQMSVREKNLCGNRIDGVDGNWSIFLTWRQFCVLKDFGFAFKIHEGPVKTYVSQYT